MTWIKVENRLPQQNDILQVKRSNGIQCKAYFYTDKINWIMWYGQKTSHWWDYITKERLDDVVEWMPHTSKDEE